MLADHTYFGTRDCSGCAGNTSQGLKYSIGRRRIASGADQQCVHQLIGEPSCLVHCQARLLRAFRANASLASRALLLCSYRPGNREPALGGLHARPEWLSARNHVPLVPRTGGLR
jgi:hypothetical protein